MEQFNLDTWLKDKSCKVCTRDGRPVRIVCWDRKSSDDDRCIVGLVDNSVREDTMYFDKLGHYSTYSEGFSDLFFADEEEKLTEFETAIYHDVCTIVTDCEGTIYDDKELKTIVKGIAKVLRNLARKEILKDLPKWKNVSGKNGAGTKDYKIVGYYLVKGNYAIYLEDLEKLLKE